MVFSILDLDSVSKQLMSVNGINLTFAANGQSVHIPAILILFEIWTNCCSQNCIILNRINIYWNTHAFMQRQFMMDFVLKEYLILSKIYYIVDIANLRHNMVLLITIILTWAKYQIDLGYATQTKTNTKVSNTLMPK